MLKKILILTASVCSLALQTTTPSINSFFPFRNNQLSTPDIDHSINIEKSYQPKLLLPVNHDNDLFHKQLDKFHHFIEVQEKAIGREVVMKVSAFLPHFDSIGHKILHANDVYINSILNNNHIPHEVQKMLILSSIKLAQYGDDMGSKLLTFYYNLVDYCL